MEGERQGFLKERGRDGGGRNPCLSSEGERQGFLKERGRDGGEEKVMTVTRA